MVILMLTLSYSFADDLITWAEPQTLFLCQNCTDALNSALEVIHTPFLFLPQTHDSHRRITRFKIKLPQDCTHKIQLCECVRDTEAGR